MIKDVTRGHVVFEFEGKIATIQGEALLPGHGSPDFVVYGALFTAWDSPHDRVEVSSEERERVLRALKDEMTEKGYVVEVE